MAIPMMKKKCECKVQGSCCIATSNRVDEAVKYRMKKGISDKDQKWVIPVPKIETLINRKINF